MYFYFFYFSPYEYTPLFRTINLTLNSTWLQHMLTLNREEISMQTVMWDIIATRIGHLILSTAVIVFSK